MTVSVGENLSLPGERIIAGKAEQIKNMDFDSLSVMYIENPLAVEPHLPLADIDFIRAEIPMTKEEVRWLSIAKLAISPQDVLFDIGAGTGSVSVEMARKAYDSIVYAVEAKKDACELIQANASKHGAFNLKVIHGKAPEALEDLPVPDKAFIGGSSGNMFEILETLLKMNPNIKITANAITLQTLNEIITGFEKHGITETDIVSVNISKSKKIGNYDMMMAQNPVYIITGNRGQAN